MRHRLSLRLLAAGIVTLLLSPHAARSQEGEADAFRYPLSVATAADGSLYVADRMLPGVWKITDGEPVVFTHRPIVPLIFLTNQSELGPIHKYVDAAREQPASVLPAVWRGDIPLPENGS